MNLLSRFKEHCLVVSLLNYPEGEGKDVLEEERVMKREGLAAVIRYTALSFLIGFFLNQNLLIKTDSKVKLIEKIS